MSISVSIPVFFLDSGSWVHERERASTARLLAATSAGLWVIHLNSSLSVGTTRDSTLEYYSSAKTIEPTLGVPIHRLIPRRKDPILWSLFGPRSFKRAPVVPRAVGNLMEI